MEKQDSANNSNTSTKKDAKQRDTKEENILPVEALEGGFTDLQEWELAHTGGFTANADWLNAKKGGFNDYDDWFQAQNEGFDSKTDWDDWNEIKESGFSDIDLFYETTNIGFFQTGLRRAFLTNLKLAKKGGFTSFQNWKEAQKWHIDSFDDWQLVKELQLHSSEEYSLVKELQSKLEGLLNELYPNQELPLSRLIEVIAQDYMYDQSKTKPHDIVYANFTKERFEELVEKLIKIIILDSDIYKYSRLTNSIFKIPSTQTSTITSPPIQRDLEHFHCPNCHNKITKISRFCQFCGQEVDKCPICQGPLLTESPAICPQCNTKFHVHHLQEVIKVTGKCPVCKNDLQEYDIK